MSKPKNIYSFYTITYRDGKKMEQLLKNIRNVFERDGFITVNSLMALAGENIIINGDGFGWLNLDGFVVEMRKKYYITVYALEVPFPTELSMLTNKVANYESNDKMVSHPDHYQSGSGLEVIDVIEAFTDGLNGIEATDTGNIIKYACRWSKKNGIQDLEKILWYTQHLINHLKNKEKENSNDEEE